MGHEGLCLLKAGGLRGFYFLQVQGAEKPGFVVIAVIPAEAGIQYLPALLDSRLRGSDEGLAFFRNLLPLSDRWSFL
jgi:hypothetical protein